MDTYLNIDYMQQPVFKVKINIKFMVLDLRQKKNI